MAQLYLMAFGGEFIFAFRTINISGEWQGLERPKGNTTVIDYSSILSSILKDL
jgi:hypothetical protein